MEYHKLLLINSDHVIEKANELSRDGWRLISVCQVITDFQNKLYGLLAFFERERQEPIVERGETLLEAEICDSFPRQTF